MGRDHHPDGFDDLFGSHRGHGQNCRLDVAAPTPQAVRECDWLCAAAARGSYDAALIELGGDQGRIERAPLLCRLDEALAGALGEKLLREHSSAADVFADVIGLPPAYVFRLEGRRYFTHMVLLALRAGRGDTVPPAGLPGYVDERAGALLVAGAAGLAENRPAVFFDAFATPQDLRRQLSSADWRDALCASYSEKPSETAPADMLWLHNTLRQTVCGLLRGDDTLKVGNQILRDVGAHGRFERRFGHLNLPDLFRQDSGS